MFGSFFSNMFTQGEEQKSTPAQNAQNGVFGNGGMFSGANFGSTMQGFGTLAGVIGNIFAQNKEAKYKEKLFDMEEKRIADEKKRQEKFDSGMRDSWS